MSGFRSAGGGAVPVPVPQWRRHFDVEPPATPTVRPHATPDDSISRFGIPFNLFCILTFVVIGRPNDYFLILVPLRLALVFTGLTVAATVFSQYSKPRLLELRETRLYLVLYAAMVAGIPFAVFRPGAFDQVIMRYVVNVIYFALFLVHVNSLARFKRMACVLVFSILLYNVFGFVSGQFIEGRYVTGSRMFDPNDAAFVEVALLGFALWVMVGRFGFTMKILALATVLSGVLLTLYTASRGGLLGLATFLGLFLWLRVENVKRGFKVGLVATVLVAAFMNADKINVERYQTLGSLENDYNFGDRGRVDTWKRGLRVFIGRPLTGVGVGGFSKAIGEQRRDEGQSGKWQTAHNAYVLVLTETGIVGGIAFFMLIGTALRTFNRLRRSPDSLPHPELAVLPGILLIGFGAQLVAATFLSQTYSMFFTLAFAMSGALNLMTAPNQPATEPFGGYSGVR